MANQDQSDEPSGQPQEQVTVDLATLMGRIRAMAASLFLAPRGPNGVVPIVRFSFDQEHESGYRTYGGSFHEMLWVTSSLVNCMAGSLPLLEKMKSAHALAVDRKTAEACTLLISALNDDLQKIQAFFDSIPKDSTSSES